MKTVFALGIVLLLAGCASVPPPCHEARGISENPKPVYPASSRRSGEEGKATLRVLVSAYGYPETIDLHQSSGFKTLDQAAIETVGNWCFYPARSNGKPVSASVLVPIAFRLDSPSPPAEKPETLRKSELAHPISMPPSPLYPQSAPSHPPATKEELQNYERKINEFMNATPRRRFVSALRAGKYQPYVDACLKKVLEMGNRSYPQEARGKIYAKVIITFTIRPSGELDELTLDRSSGYKILDDAAMSAGRSAAPFEAFPPEIATEATSLSITTPLTFAPSDAGSTEAQPIIPPDLSRQAAPGR